jgi:prepilin-type N-terminal cleavage/methylation domain-containing protein/prepilin-type processing-associated H-X9-DG protein
MRTTASQRRGFTLIELLAVVAIIAILASLLLPALSRAKASAQFAQCKNNVKLMSMTLLLYVDDYDNYPLEGTHWRLFAIVSGVSSRNIPCPSERAPEYANLSPYGYNLFGMTHFPVGAGFLQGQLGLGGALTRVVGAKQPRNDLIPQTATAVTAPANMIALGDGVAESRGKLYRTVQNELGFNFNFVGTVEGADAEKAIRRRHKSRANIGFCDGHVEGMRFDKLFAETDEAYRRWNVDGQAHPELRRR